MLILREIHSPENPRVADSRGKKKSDYMKEWR